MDEVAEKGQAAHWIYKEGYSASGSVHWLARIRNILENPSDDSLENDSNSRMELYSDEVFIFTPQGDLRKLPAHSTVLDFAYEIHSNIGNSCTGGKVNGKIVTLKQELKNGDSVEIITSKNQSPKQGTATERNHVLHILQAITVRIAGSEDNVGNILLYLLVDIYLTHYGTGTQNLLGCSDW